MTEPSLNPDSIVLKSPDSLCGRYDLEQRHSVRLAIM